MSTQTEYKSVAVLENTFWKLKLWQSALDQRWDRRVTMDEVVEFLCDNTGVPEEWQ